MDQKIGCHVQQENQDNFSNASSVEYGGRCVQTQFQGNIGLCFVFSSCQSRRSWNLSTHDSEKFETSRSGYLGHGQHCEEKKVQRMAAFRQLQAIDHQLKLLDGR